jgi:hypothetical protein
MEAFCKFKIFWLQKPRHQQDMIETFNHQDKVGACPWQEMNEALKQDMDKA